MCYDEAVASCGCGGIGRRAGFRSQFSQGSGGSSPLIRTNSSTRLSPCRRRAGPDPPPCYDAPFMAEYSIGIDLGGTNLRAAAIDRSGKMLDKISGTTNFSEGKDALLSGIVEEIS